MILRTEDFYESKEAELDIIFLFSRALTRVKYDYMGSCFGWK